MIDIYTERKKLGLTQTQFAEAIGVSYQTVQNWEKGSKIPEGRLKMIKSFIHTGKEKKEDFDFDEEALKKEGKLDIDSKIISLEPQLEPTGYYLPDVYAAAGLDKEMVNDELNRIPVNIPNWEKNMIFINVSGDSMYPEYCSGDIIGIKETEFDYIIFGFAYVVILQNGDVYVKYIKKGIDNEHIILESENEFYEPKEIQLSKVKKVYQVKGVITKKSM